MDSSLHARDEAETVSKCQKKKEGKRFHLCCSANRLELGLLLRFTAGHIEGHSSR